MSNKHEPAFPTKRFEEVPANHPARTKGGHKYIERTYPGLTKLEEFTKAAMQGLLSSTDYIRSNGIGHDLAEKAVEIATLTLNELEKIKSNGRKENNVATTKE